MKNQVMMRKGSEKKSLNHATRYSFESVRAFLVKASLVAREKAVTSDKITQSGSIALLY